MINKFLDADGISYLWNQISLQDYPNNETLVAVINAIDKNKADKDEILTMDEIYNEMMARLPSAESQAF